MGYTIYNEPLANKDLANTDFSKTFTRSDEKSCTKNLANTDLANTDIFKIVIVWWESQICFVPFYQYCNYAQIWNIFHPKEIIWEIEKFGTGTPYLFFSKKITKIGHFENGILYPFLSKKTNQFEKKNIPKKTLTRSDEKSCTKN